MKKKSTSNNYTIQFFSMCSKEGIKGYYNGNWQDQLTQGIQDNELETRIPDYMYM